VIKGLGFLHSTTTKKAGPIAYRSLKASNIFLRKIQNVHLKIEVRLAAFGQNVTPEGLTDDTRTADCHDLGYFVTHMILGSDNDLPSIKKNPEKSYFAVAKKSGCSILLDFLTLCFAEKGNIEKIAKVSFSF
jgi:hypothetical protein